MNDVTSDRLRLLAERQSMIDGSLFVGRREEFDTLREAQVAWIYGPGRTGKSSLARRLIERCTGPVWLDAGDVSSGDLDEVLQRVCERAGQPAASPRPSYERLVRAGRIDAVVFDEFDHVAVNLDGDGQAFLRRLAEECRGTRMIIITRRPPASIVEEVVDVRSRLLGVAITRALRPLEQGDIRALLRRVDVDGIDGFAEVMWREVGGHPISVMSVAQALVLAALRGGLPGGCEALPDGVESVVDETLDMQARSLWLDLPPLVRAFLLREDGSEEARRAARNAGYFAQDQPVRPKRLLAVGGLLGARIARSANDPRSLPDIIDESVFAVNRATLRRCGHPFFRPSNEVHGRYVLSRACSGERAFRDVVDHLYKRFYEAAKAHAGDAPPAKPLPPGLWELAAPWRKNRVMAQVCAMRQDFFHDQTPRLDDRRHEAALTIGGVYRALCGREVPTTGAEWTRCRDELLAGISTGLDDLLDHIESTPA